MFISSRYHGAVFAAILGKPVICVEVEQKLRLVSELLGTGAFLWFHPFHPMECMASFQELEKYTEKAVQNLKRVVSIADGDGEANKFINS